MFTDWFKVYAQPPVSSHFLRLGTRNNRERGAGAPWRVLPGAPKAMRNARRHAAAITRQTDTCLSRASRSRGMRGRVQPWRAVGRSGRGGVSRMRAMGGCPGLFLLSRTNSSREIARLAGVPVFTLSHGYARQMGGPVLSSRLLVPGKWVPRLCGLPALGFPVPGSRFPVLGSRFVALILYSTFIHRQGKSQHGRRIRCNS